MGGAWKERVAVLAAALWWGSLTTTGLWVVPLLFVHLPTPAMAGQMAARLFTAQTWVALGCGVLMMMASRSRQQSNPMNWARGALGFVLAGVLLALLAEFAVAPRILARQNLKLWHTVGSAMYLLQWVCAAIVLYKTTAQAASPVDRQTTGEI
jgi:hypothetical protein